MSINHIDTYGLHSMDASLHNHQSIAWSHFYLWQLISRTGVVSFLRSLSDLHPAPNTMSDAGENTNQPYESELFGDATATDDTRFGYEWYERTYGHGAVMIEWDDKGTHSLVTVPSTATAHPAFKELFASSKTVSWFKLKKGEYFTEIHFRESAAHERISALCFRTNMRRSQWYGSAEGTERKITAAPGYYIHAIHGSHRGGICRNLGAYFVPFSLRVSTALGVVKVADSEVLGSQTFDGKSNDSYGFPAANIRAIVIKIDDKLQNVWPLDPVEYQRFLAVTNSPLGPGHNLLVLADGELMTALRACVVNGHISAIQFKTTLGATEWFGPLPGPDDVIETRSIRDEPTATHIGGIFGMGGPDHIKSIGVHFYKQT